MRQGAAVSPPPDGASVAQRIAHSFPNLSQSHREVARYVLDHPLKAATLPVAGASHRQARARIRPARQEPRMKTPLILAVAAALLGLLPAAQAARLSPEQKLAKALEGREAGEPVKCIPLRDIRSSRIIAGTAILYDTGRTLYVNTPPGGAKFLRADQILVTDTHSSELCDIDFVQLLDPGSRMPSGSVGLGEFVPYTKIQTGK